MAEQRTVEEEYADTPVSEAVVYRIAECAGVDPLDLPPLYRTIDTDALDQLFSRADADHRRFEGSVEFTYAGWMVRVTGDGHIDVSR